MKNNRKNRNLQFIRTKNKLRTGKVKFYISEKVSNEIEEDEDYYNELIEKGKKALLKIYKLKLSTYQLHPHQIIEDDLSNNMHTNCVSFSKS